MTATRDEHADRTAKSTSFKRSGSPVLPRFVG
jgi:hypothetical protein